MKRSGESEQDLCVPSLFSILIRDKAHVLRSGNLLLPNVVSFPNKTSQSRQRVKIVFIDYSKDQYLLL